MTEWSEIVRTNSRGVWCTIHRLLGCEDSADECLQEVFVSALKLSQRQEVTNWAGLLRTLAIARSMDHLRRKYRTLEKMRVRLKSPIVDARIQDPSEVLHGQELADSLRAALSEIDEKQSQAFLLSQLEGMSYSEIAQQLSVTENYVGVLIHRARIALQKKLQAFRPESDRSSTHGRRAK